MQVLEIEPIQNKIITSGFSSSVLFFFFVPGILERIFFLARALKFMECIFIFFKQKKDEKILFKVGSLLYHLS